MTWVLFLITVICVAYLSLLIAMHRFGRRRTHYAQADVVIVLGARIIDQEVSPVLAERLNQGVQLWREGLAGKILLTGGKADVWGIDEAAAALAYVLEQGVPRDAILMENRSRTTFENMVEARRVMKAEGLSTCLIVSDPHHLFRALAMAKYVGLIASPAPAVTSRYRSWRKRIPFLLKESRSYLAFLVLRR